MIKKKEILDLLTFIKYYIDSDKTKNINVLLTDLNTKINKYLEQSKKF